MIGPESLGKCAMLIGSEPKALQQAADSNGRGKDEVEIRLQDDFDHSYYFVSCRDLRIMFRQ